VSLTLCPSSFALPHRDRRRRGRTSVESGPIALPAVSASARVTARAPRVGGRTVRAVRASDARDAVRAIGAS
jgi:hypothetical protein